MLQSWLWGLISFSRGGPANWPFHQSTNVYLQSFIKLSHSCGCLGCGAQTVWKLQWRVALSLSARHQEQTLQASFLLIESRLFGNFSTSFSSSALSAWRLEFIKSHISQDTVNHFQYPGNHRVEVINKHTKITFKKVIHHLVGKDVYTYSTIYC